MRHAQRDWLVGNLKPASMISRKKREEKEDLSSSFWRNKGDKRERERQQPILHDLEKKKEKYIRKSVVFYSFEKESKK